eukprot:INCI17162.1.p1 GENE.INCI17162.1~~INCI17162.1.p1  ORF type:complete len:256 (+),score=41.44 INCI17162.1:300-1067(+)
MSSDAVASDTFKGFKSVVDARFSCKRFVSDPIPEDVLRALIAVTQRAPSSFNTQPYRIVLVRDPKQREALAACMSGKNAPACLEAPVVAVFCADTEITRESLRLQTLLRKNPDVPGPYVNAIPGMVARLSTGFSATKKFFLTPMYQLLAHCRRKVLGATIEQPVGATAWAFKQVTFAADHYLLAATALGLATRPMEGIDAVKAAAVLGIPDRFEIPFAVATGFAGMPFRPSPRYATDEVVFEDRFGAPAFASKKE